MRKQVVFCLTIMMIMSLVSGCAFVKSKIDSYTDTDAGIQSSEHESEGKSYVAPGVLTQVEYSYASGTMMGQDFGIEVSQSEIISLFYFDEEDHTQKDVTHIPITSDQWKQIEEAVSVITPGLEEVEHQEKQTNWITDHMMQDGGDSTSFALTWENDGKSTQVYYSTPHDDGYLDLLDTLKGMTKYDTTEELKNKDDGEDTNSEYLIEDSDIIYLFPHEVEGFTPEQLRIARNEIYARHGRRFNDPELQAYFDEKSWYHGTIEPDQFDESCLNEQEKVNIRFLKLLEPVEAKDNLSDAPYLSILNQYGFEGAYSLLSFETHDDGYIDRGGYYEVNATFGQAIEAPGDLKIGDKVSLEFNHVTGEMRTLTLKEDGLYEEGHEDYPYADYYYTPSTNGSPVTLYHDSDDRMDRPVYEGVFYIRKDATYGYFPEYDMKPVLETSIYGEKYISPAFSNVVVFDSKGYAVRLVYCGD